MAANSNYQLAIINPEVQDNYLVSVIDTVIVRAFKISCAAYSSSSSVVDLESVSLIDDPTVNCKLELSYVYRGESVVNVSFLSEVPPAYEYEISLYYIDVHGKLVHVSDLSVKNVLRTEKFAIPCKSAFENHTSLLYRTDKDYHFAFCIKFSRKDILANFNKKPALLMPTYITDCSLLFENTAMSNYTIIVEDRKFLVHKEILAAKSLVFLSMFESEMREKKENQATIKDIEAEIFHEFLRYIYTNLINDLNVNAEKLLMVAEKYDVPKLKLICGDEMSRSLTVENAVRTLMIADQFSLKSLKDTALGFIRNNLKSILNTEEYKALYKSGQAYLLNDILQMFS